MNVLIPNLFEIEKILNRAPTAYSDLEEAGYMLLARGAESVLLRGGHIKDPLFRQDYWTNGADSFWLANQRVPEIDYEYADAIYSAMLAVYLEQGYSLKDALVIAKMHENAQIRQRLPIQNVKWFENNRHEDVIDLPYLSPAPVLKLPSAFKQSAIGLYPIVDSSDWLERLLSEGVKCIQLRIKKKEQAYLEAEIRRSVALAKKYAASLFINDYWELAIHLGAQGVHLGQDDLHGAEIDKIYNAGLYLGVSTHCFYEVARAHALNPSYIACGPIYPTISKSVSFEALGIEQLRLWRRILHYPLVAIGGINLERLPGILNAGVEGIALISAITKASDPRIATRHFLKQVDSHRKNNSSNKNAI